MLEKNLWMDGRGEREGGRGREREGEGEREGGRGREREGERERTVKMDNTTRPHLTYPVA